MLASMSPTKQFALGTRYAKGVEIDEGWPLYRRVISSGARMLALPLTSASDPMSGFFGIRKETVSLINMHLARIHSLILVCRLPLSVALLSASPQLSPSVPQSA